MVCQLGLVENFDRTKHIVLFSALELVPFPYTNIEKNDSQPTGAVCSSWTFNILCGVTQGDVWSSLFFFLWGEICRVEAEITCDN